MINCHILYEIRMNLWTFAVSRFACDQLRPWIMSMDLMKRKFVLVQSNPFSFMEISRYFLSFFFFIESLVFETLWISWCWKNEHQGRIVPPLEISVWFLFTICTETKIFAPNAKASQRSLYKEFYLKWKMTVLSVPPRRTTFPREKYSVFPLVRLMFLEVFHPCC